VPELQAYTTQGSPAGTTSDAWEDAPTTPAAGTSAALPDSTEMMVLAIGQARNDGGSHQGELEARVGSTRIGLVAHRSTFNGGNGATGGGQLFAARRITTGVGDALNFRRRSSSAGNGTLLGSLRAVAWPLTNIPASLRHHSESPNDDAAASQPPDVAEWAPVGAEGAGQLRFTPTATGDYLVLASCELFPLAGMPAFRSLTARLAYREVSTPTWTFVDANDYYLRDPDPSIGTSRACQGFAERVTLTAGTEYVIAILADGEQANGLMGVGRIGVHAFAPGTYESVVDAEVGATAVGGSATLDVGGAAVTASPSGTRSFVALSTFATAGAGIGFWTDHFLRSDEGTPGDTGDDDDGDAYGHGGDNFDGDQNLRVTAMRFLGGISADHVLTPRITTLGGSGNNYDRISTVAFSLYAPDAGGFVDVEGEAAGVAATSAILALDHRLEAEASAVAETSATVSTASTTVEVSGHASAVAETLASVALDQRLETEESGGVAESQTVLRLDIAIGGEAPAVSETSAGLALDLSVGGEAAAVAATSATVVEAIEGLIDIAADMVAVIATSVSLAQDVGVTGTASGVAGTALALRQDVAVGGELSVVVDTSATLLGSSTVDPQWLESILSESTPFTTKIPDGTT